MGLREHRLRHFANALRNDHPSHAIFTGFSEGPLDQAGGIIAILIRVLGHPARSLIEHHEGITPTPLAFKEDLSTMGEVRHDFAHDVALFTLRKPRTTIHADNDFPPLFQNALNKITKEF